MTVLSYNLTHFDTCYQSLILKIKIKYILSIRFTLFQFTLKV